jgi:H+/Cl- antiporter ClcA
MAVTKIHRTSRMTLIIGVIISLAVMAMFYLGGQVPAHEKIVADMSQPKFTDIVLYWAYTLLAITIGVLIIFALVSFLKQLKNRPKKALGGLLVILALVALLVVAFIAGDGTLLNIPGYDGGDNNPKTLKMTDMWLFSAYVMLVLTFLAIIVLPLFKRKG